MPQPFAFQPQPQLARERDHLVQFSSKLFTRFLALERMQLELETARMMLDQIRTPRQWNTELLQPFMAFATTPLIATERREDRIPKRELCLANVSANEVRIF